MRLLASFALIILLDVAAIPAAAKKTKSRKTNSSAPGLAQLQKMTARYAPTTLAGGYLEAFDRGPAGAGQTDRSRSDHERHFPGPVLERQSGPVCAAAEGHHAAGQSAAAVFLDQQESLVRAG